MSSTVSVAPAACTSPSSSRQVCASCWSRSIRFPSACRLQLAGARGSDASERLLYSPNSRYSRKAFGLRDFRLCRRALVRAAGSHDDRRSGYSGHFLLVGPTVNTAMVQADVQCSRCSVAIWAPHTPSTSVTGIRPLSVSLSPIVPLLPWLLLLATVYFLLNSWLVAIVVGLQKRRSRLSVWRQSFLWLSLNYYSGASVAALILPYLVQAGDSAFLYVGVFSCQSW